MISSGVLITGGAGFIGSNLALALVRAGHSVTVLDRLSEQIHGPVPEKSPLLSSIVDKVRFLRGDVRDERALISSLEGVRTVVHLAAETGTGQSMYDVRRYSDVNVGGTALLLDLIANGKTVVEKLVVASSRAIYGEGKYSCPEHGFVFPDSRLVEDMEKGDFEVHCPVCRVVCSMEQTDEDSALRPISVYGVTKLAQEQMVLAIARSAGLSAFALRYQNVFGPGQSLSNPYTGILSIFSTRIRNGLPINIFEDGAESRDFVYIDDVVAATKAAVEHEGHAVLSLNVGTGKRTDVLTVARLLSRHLGREVPVEVSGRFRLGDIRHNVADISRIRAALGFEPRVGIEEGLRRFTEWVSLQRVEADTYDASIEELRRKGLYK